VEEALRGFMDARGLANTRHTHPKHSNDDEMHITEQKLEQAKTKLEQQVLMTLDK
jgi:hypothetical protein